MKSIKFTTTSIVGDKEILINPECVTDVFTTDDGTAIYNQGLELAIVKESMKEVCKRLTMSSEPCGNERIVQGLSHDVIIEEAGFFNEHLYFVTFNGTNSCRQGYVCVHADEARAIDRSKISNYRNGIAVNSFIDKSMMDYTVKSVREKLNRVSIVGYIYRTDHIRGFYSLKGDTESYVQSCKRIITENMDATYMKRDCLLKVSYLNYEEPGFKYFHSREDFDRWLYKIDRFYRPMIRCHKITKVEWVIPHVNGKEDTVVKVEENPILFKVAYIDIYDHDRHISYFKSTDDFLKWMEDSSYSIRIFSVTPISNMGQSTNNQPVPYNANSDDEIPWIFAMNHFALMTRQERRDSYRSHGISYILRGYSMPNEDKDEYSNQMNEWMHNLHDKMMKKNGYASTEEENANLKCYHEAMMASIVHPEDIDENKVVELKFNDDGSFEAKLIDVSNENNKTDE